MSLEALIPLTLPAWLPGGVHAEADVLIGLVASSPLLAPHLASCGEGCSPCMQGPSVQAVGAGGHRMSVRLGDFLCGFGGAGCGHQGC